MHFTREERRLELQLVMAGVTVRAGCAVFELAVMNIFVAIAAQGVRHRSTEVITLVALRAIRFRVFPMQRKPGFIVIEAASGQECLPARRRVAGLARALKRCILKSATVRIGVAVLTIGKSQTLVMRGGFTGLGSVTPSAGDVLMQPGERKTGAGMIEALGRLPYILIVATQAFSP